MKKNQDAKTKIFSKIKSPLFYSTKKFFFLEYDMRFFKIEKNKFSSSKKAMNQGKMDIEKMLVPYGFAHDKNKETDEKYFVVHKTGKTKIRPLFIKLSQMARFLIESEESQYISFLIKDKKSVSVSVSCPVYDRKYLNTKL